MKRVACSLMGSNNEKFFIIFPLLNKSEEEAEALRQKFRADYGATCWYDWCTKKWGTKWNSYDHFDVEGFDLAFYTAWSPPEGVYRELTERFGTSITAIAHDEGGFYCLEMLFENGQYMSCNHLEGSDLEKVEHLRYGC